jgi:poly-beta-1,6-N-acetyl-D-glucosamine synthase
MSAWIFWGALALIAYTYAGYPLLLWCLSALHARPVARQPIEPEIVMVVVAYNEERRIAAKIETCLAQNYPAERLSVLVCSDGSTDGTVALVEGFGNPRVSALAFNSRRGKAACLNDAVAACRADVIVFTDARQRLHPDAVRELVANFADGQVGAVSGELVFVGDDDQPFEQGIGAYWRYEKFIRNHEARTGSAMGVTGALYALRRACFAPIPAATVLDDVAIPMVAVMAGWRVGFEARAIAYDRPSNRPSEEKVRKVRTLAGNFQLLSLYPRLLSPLGNPAWWRFMSHKVLRLAGPALLALALAANVALAFDSAGYRWFLALHLLGYGLVGAALLLPVLQRFKPIGLAVTFAHLNYFVVLGLISFLTNRQMQLWTRTAEPGDKTTAVRATEKAQ